MSLSADEFELVSRLIAEIEPSVKTLNNWERGFIEDQIYRLDEHGAQTFFSRKQWDAIRKIHKKVTGEEPVTTDEDGW